MSESAIRFRREEGLGLTVNGTDVHCVDAAVLWTTFPDKEDAAVVYRGETKATGVEITVDGPPLLFAGPDDTLQMLRETLCMCQTALPIAYAFTEEIGEQPSDVESVARFQRELAHRARLQHLIDSIDRQLNPITEKETDRV